MQEIAPHVYIENGYPGVTLGAVNWPHGLILIDAPFLPDDIRSWRSGLLNLGGGVDRMLVNLDAQYDRTLGTRLVECTVAGHEAMAEVFKTRPVTFKPQTAETGADWELYNGIGTVRWLAPEITFRHRLEIHWDGNPIVLESHPGPSNGSIWVVLPHERIIFLGDAILPNQPPFLANADIPAWLETLHLLLTPEYRNFLLVSGRGGLIATDQIRVQMKFLEKTAQQLEKLAEKKAPAEETEKLAINLMKSFNPPKGLTEHYERRLKWGLHHYYTRQFSATPADDAS